MVAGLTWNNLPKILGDIYLFWWSISESRNNVRLRVVKNEKFRLITKHHFDNLKILQSFAYSDLVAFLNNEHWFVKSFKYIWWFFRSLFIRSNFNKSLASSALFMFKTSHTKFERFFLQVDFFILFTNFFLFKSSKEMFQMP